MRYLSVEEIILIHEYELQRYGGAPGIKSIELLESAVHRPKTSFGGQEEYSTKFEKAAALMHALIKNHPFTDGNKRTALVASIVLLKLNGLKVNLGQKRLVEHILNIAKRQLSVQETANLLKKNARPCN